jgi:excisionase family DNA binding protein
VENVGLDALDELMTVPEIATVLRVSKPTVWRLIYSGTLESKKIGASRRVARSVVRAYMQRATAPVSGMVPAASEPPKTSVA